MQQISVGSDHAGFKFKELIISHLRSKKISVNDQGAFSEESVDYPDFAHKVAEDVMEGRSGLGILCCGSGNGVAMAANKHKGVRAALCWQPEIASLAVRHNNANVLCLPARFISEDEAIQIIDSFLEATFEGGRHERRVEKIEC